MLKEKLAKVINRWHKENLGLVSPYSERRILDSFAAVGNLISNDVFELYNVVGGMSDGEIDLTLLSFWSLEQVIKENSLKSEYTLLESEYTLFADFLVYSHLYAFKYENENTSSIHSDYETGEFVKIANSVEEFFNIYLTNPNKIGLFEE